jgi:cytochrome c
VYIRLKHTIVFVVLGVAGALAFGVDVARFPVGTQVTDPVVARRILDADAARPVRPWAALKASDIPAGPDGKLIRYGMDLMTRTSELIGPRITQHAMRFAHNDLNCVACHQAGPSGLPGTKKFSMPLYNAARDYPKLDIKSMKVISLQMRIQGMLGAGEAKITPGTREMRALVAYITWLGKNNTDGTRIAGSGLDEAMPLPRRAADPGRGKVLYQTNCIACHGAEGLGVKNPGFERGKGYAFPPIAGPDAYDDGGHMYMIPLLTRFLHVNMPLGATADQPKLSVDDAYDIAAYVNSALPRKHDAARQALYPLAQFRPAGFVIPEQFPGQESAYRRHRFGPFTEAR